MNASSVDTATGGVKLKMKDGGKLYAARCGERILRRGARTHTGAAEYAALVARRLERWKRVDPLIMALPIGYHDRIYNELTIQFTLRERLKLLLGWNVQLRLSILCGNRPGRVESSEQIELVRQKAGGSGHAQRAENLERESALSHALA